MNRLKLLPSLISQKFTLRLGAVGLACLLWLFVVSENEYSIPVDIPLEVRNLSLRRALKEEVPEFVQARLKGTGRAHFKALLLRKFVDFKLVLDLERISEQYDFNLNDYFEKYPQKVVIPSTFELEFIEVVFPSQIHISLDEYMVKTVPIFSRLTIQPAVGYIQVGPVEFSPYEIDIGGSKEIVESLTQVDTQIDSLVDLDIPVEGSIELRTLGRLIEYSVFAVDYRIDIQPVSERIISDVPVQVINKDEQVRIFVNPQTVSLTIVGGANLIADVNPEDILVTIDFTEWSNRVQFYDPVITVPNGILEWRDLSPRSLELVVAKESS